LASKGFDDLAHDIINAGLCTSCGTCAGVCPSGFIHMGYEMDEPEPFLDGECNPCNICYESCPGRDIPLMDLDKTTFSRTRDIDNEPLGIFQHSYRGCATNPDTREGGGSGGVVNAVLRYALDEGIIDGAVIAGWDSKRPWRTKPFVATSADEIEKGMRSTLMVCPVNESLRDAIVTRKLKKIAVCGVPCHMHALRKMQMAGRPRNFVNSIVFMMGVFCAANYYYLGTEHLVREYGKVSDIKDVTSMDYRAGKWPGSLIVTTKDGKMHHVASKHEYTWHFLGSASYKRDRCLMCIDWSAESADISCGDIFTPIQEQNRKWTGVLVRTSKGQEIIDGAAKKGHLTLKDLDPTPLPSSGLGWEAKKHAAMYRLMQRKKYGWPVPDYQYPAKLAYVPFDRTFPE
jgi:coenzyme F420 hydrogenase subunit beta